MMASSPTNVDRKAHKKSISHAHTHTMVLKFHTRGSCGPVLSSAGSPLSLAFSAAAARCGCKNL
eukprot:746705-Hanusia_phi.AAC.2